LVTSRIVLDGLNRLKAIHARHHVIHEDHIGLVTREVFDGGFRGIRGIHGDFVTLENS
jgi:hypothetical protein